MGNISIYNVPKVEREFKGHLTENKMNLVWSVNILESKFYWGITSGKKKQRTNSRQMKIWYWYIWIYTAKTGSEVIKIFRADVGIILPFHVKSSAIPESL